MKRGIIFLLCIMMFFPFAACKKQSQDIESIYNDGTQKQEDKINELMGKKSGQYGSQTELPKPGEEIAKIQTNLGTITIRFFPDIAPKTVENFKKLANEKFYDNIIFHRVIQDFMIQGGDPDGNSTGGPGYTIPAELSSQLHHIRGAVAMARLSDEFNPKKESSGSQFYIVHQDSLFLDNEYTIFGQVIKGIETVDAIANTAVNNERPVADVIIQSIKIEKYEEV